MTNFLGTVCFKRHNGITYGIAASLHTTCIRY